MKIEKTMSLSHEEFANSMEQFAGPQAGRQARNGAAVAVEQAGVRAQISYEPLEGVRLGGLLALPRAKVTVSLDEGPEATQREFLRRFDIAFQRGGG